MIMKTTYQREEKVNASTDEHTQLIQPECSEYVKLYQLVLVEIQPTRRESLEVTAAD